MSADQCQLDMQKNEKSPVLIPFAENGHRILRTHFSLQSIGLAKNVSSCHLFWLRAVGRWWIADTRACLDLIEIPLHVAALMCSKDALRKEALF